MPAELEDALDRCVRCGLCLPHCPTFRLSGDEAESPRGRIILIQGLLDGTIAPDHVLRQHLDACLLCRACESVCPAAVPFAEIMDTARPSVPPQGRVSRWLRGAIIRPRLLTAAMVAARLFAVLIRIRPVGGGSSLRRALGLLRFVRPRARPEAAARDDRRPSDRRVGLFVGCLDPWLHPRAVEDAAWVIRALGHTAVIPADQVCCGALHQHAGAADAAAELRRRNIAAFETAQVDTLLSLSTGCGMTLTQGDDTLASVSTDICTWVAQHLPEAGAKLATVHGRVTLHRPCSAKYGSDDAESPLRLLQSIPGLEVHRAGPGAGCCGAAGSYMIDQGATADRLGELAVAELDPTAVAVTPNLGCALQLATHTDRNDPALHPISVLRMALSGGGSIG
jgi:glycolate dehydrogenase iron-sulfur subunit